jgi:hypothetical protein
MSWLLHPLAPFALDGAAGVVAGVLWRAHGAGAAAAAVMVAAGLVALATRAAHQAMAWGEPDGGAFRIPDETPPGPATFGDLTVLTGDLVFNLIVATVVAGLAYLGL